MEFDAGFEGGLRWDHHQRQESEGHHSQAKSGDGDVAARVHSAPTSGGGTPSGPAAAAARCYSEVSAASVADEAPVPSVSAGEHGTAARASTSSSRTGMGLNVPETATKTAAAVSITNPYAKRRRIAGRAPSVMGTAGAPPTGGGKVGHNSLGAPAARSRGEKSGVRRRHHPSGSAPAGPCARPVAAGNVEDGVSHPGIGEDASALIISACDKAGMDGIPRERIDAIILRESGNSLFMRQQRRRDAAVNDRIGALTDRLEQQIRQNPNWRSEVEEDLEPEIASLKAGRPRLSTRCVVDMDMFYMACEILDKPHLGNVPACVGGNMICTSNYVARKYGVRSAMAGFVGDRLVEELSGGQQRLVHVPLNFGLYRDKSDVVRRVLSGYDPHLRAYSLDEVYMNLDAYLQQKILHPDWDHERIKSHLFKSSDREIQQEQQDGKEEAKSYLAPEEGHAFVEGCNREDQQDGDVDASLVLENVPESSLLLLTSEVVNEMRARVKCETGGLTCSAGVAPNFMLAKIASDRNKPNGQLVVPSRERDVLEFLHPLPTRKVGGIGRVTEKILKAFNIRTVRDLFEQRALVRLLFKPASASFLLRASLGCSSSDGKDDEDHEDSSSSQQKGISRERTFKPGQSWTEINSRLEDIGRLLSSDMQRKGLWGKNVTVKVKLHTFDCLSKSRTLAKHIQAPTDLVRNATELLRDIRKDYEGPTFSVRLLGIRLSSFRDGESGDHSDNSKHHQQSIDRFLVAAHEADRKPSPLRCRNSNSSRASVGGSKGGQATLEAFLAKSDDVAAGGEANSYDPDCVPLVICPICNRPFPENQNAALNRHVDACLNSRDGNGKRPKITHFFTKPIAKEGSR